MADDPDNKIAFRISADGAVETADDFKKAADAATQLSAATKAVNDALDAAAAKQQELAAQVTGLSVAQVQAIQTLAGVSAASRQAAADIAAQGASARDASARISEFGSTTARAFDDSSTQVKRFQESIQPATQAVDDLIARERELASIQPTAAITAPQTGAAAPPPPVQAAQPIADTSGNQQALAAQKQALDQLASQASAVAEQIQKRFDGIRLNFQIPADQVAAINAQIAALASDFQQKFGGDGAEVAKDVADNISAGLNEGFQRGLITAQTNLPQEIAGTLGALREQFQIPVTLKPEGVDQVTAASAQEADAGASAFKAKWDEITAQISQGSSAIRDDLGKIFGDLSNQEDAIAKAMHDGVVESFHEGIQQLINEHGIDAVRAQFEAAYGDIGKAFSGLQGDEINVLKAALTQETAAVTQAASAQAAVETKAEADGIAAKKALDDAYDLDRQASAKASVVLQNDFELQANQELYSSILDKFQTLEQAKSDLEKSSTAVQRSDVEKQMLAEADFIKKAFDGVNVGKLVAGGTEATTALAGLNANIDQLSSKLAAVKAMNDAAAQSGFLSRLAQYKAEADSVNNTTASTSATLSRAFSGAEGSSRSLRTELGGTARVISQLGNAFRQIVPDVGEFQRAADTGLRAMSGLIGVVGGGAAGIMAGGLIAGLGALGVAMSSAKKEADELAKSTEANQKALGDYLTQITNLRQVASQRQAKSIGESTKEQDLSAGKGSGQDYAVEVETLKNLIAQKDKVAAELQKAYEAGDRDEVVKLASIQNAIAAAPGRIAALSKLGTSTRADELGQKQAAAANKQDKLDFEGDLAEAGGMPENKKGGKPDDESSKTLARLDANRAAIEKLRNMEADYNDKQLEQAKQAQNLQADYEIKKAQEALDAIQQKYAEFRDNQKGLVKLDLDDQASTMKQEITDAIDAVHTHDAEQIAKVEEMRRSAWQESHDLFMQLESDKANQVQINIQKEKSERTQVTSSLMALGTTAAQLTAKQLEEAVKGHKIQAAMILEGIGDAMVAEGVRVMFQGGAALLMGNYASGGGLLALGAAEIGVGLGLGAAGAAATPPSASGNAASTTNNSSPIRDNQQTSNSDQQKGPTVIYIDMPTVVSPTAEDGLRVRQAIDRASQVYGAPV